MPSKRYTELSLAAQTAYAELLDSARAQELMRSVARLSGGFASKQVKGRRYWYFQYRDLDGAVRQLYVGPDDERVQSLVTQSKPGARPDLEPLARSVIALGGERVLPKHFRIIRRLGEYGFFRAGGVLIGTHAFLAHGNLLGVRWRGGARTQDLDFARAGPNISIALPATIEVDVPRALESLEMGFLPMSAFGGDSGATYLSLKDPELRVDFLTTRHRGGETPLKVERLKVMLQPFKFLEYVLEAPTQAVVFSEAGAVVVNVPSPATYALHKLLVWGERETRYRTKATKDLQQAAALLAYYGEHDAQAVRRAWDDLLARGRGWVSRARAGSAALAASAPDLRVAELLPISSRR